MGNLRWYSSPQPRFQAVGLAETRCETSVCVNLDNLKQDSSKGVNLKIEGHSSWDTCPWHTCVKKGGRRERASGWEKKNKTSKKDETSDNIRGWKLTWALFKDNACHLCSYVTWQAGARKGTWQTFTQHGSCFCKHKNSLRLQANNSLSCSWNNSYFKRIYETTSLWDIAVTEIVPAGHVCKRMWPAQQPNFVGCMQISVTFFNHKLRRSRTRTKPHKPDQRPCQDHYSVRRSEARATRQPIFFFTSQYVDQSPLPISRHHQISPVLGNLSGEAWQILCWPHLLLLPSS